MERENLLIKEVLNCFLFISLLIFLSSCEGIYTIQGKVFAINGEALPGVCVSSPEIFSHVVTNTKGSFVFRLSKPISKLEFIKSDYLPFTVSIHFAEKKYITLTDIFLTPKPSTPGVYFLDNAKNRYLPLIKGKIERTQIEKQNSVPSIKLSEITQVKDTFPKLYVFRLPQYDVTMYQMKEYVPKVDEMKSDKKVDKTEKQSDGKDTPVPQERKIWIPDKPVLTHTKFLSEMDTSLFLLKPVSELKPGVYCINWRAFEMPFPRISECFLFSIVEESEIKESSTEPATSDTKKEEKDKMTGIVKKIADN
ncbi:MAG TPA: hypothetical protein PLA12_02755 [Candidatus Hydrogenedens sp.]|nr:hypothetical protein [Candidatus Hydrogenedens sp.]